MAAKKKKKINPKFEPYKKTSFEDQGTDHR